MGPGDIVVTPAGTSFHERTLGPCRWRAMSLPSYDLSAASQAVLGHDQTVGSVATIGVLSDWSDAAPTAPRSKAIRPSRCITGCVV
jgi:hypothetical protein